MFLKYVPKNPTPPSAIAQAGNFTFVLKFLKYKGKEYFLKMEYYKYLGVFGLGTNKGWELH
jgi:hypothetical protein